MDTRIEIYRDGLWRTLRLRDGKQIRYNALINKIGDPRVREISHTNTFSLPPIHQNTSALDINLLSASSLASALNKRYPAKYYVEDKLLQQGFLIINNTGEGDINVNFIDKALEITEKWGSTTYKELLESEDLSIPEDYRLAILEMVNYNMSKSEVLTPLTEVGIRGYKLAEFPNGLNAIGDNFQLQLDGTRKDNSFNPYQSRPIFNAKALFDLACEAYGYSATFDDSINWEKVADIFMVEEGLNSNKVSNEGQFKTTFPATKRFNYRETDRPGHGFKYVIPGFDPSVTQAIKPNDVPGWVHPPNSNYYGTKDFSYALDYRDDKSIFVPNTNASTFGQIKFTAALYRPRNTDNYPQEIVAYSCWENSTPGGQVIFQLLELTDKVFETDGSSLSFTVEKNQLASTPPFFSNGKLIGVIFSHSKRHRYREQYFTHEYWYNTVVTETYLTEDIISYDDNGQYIANTIDLRHATPNKTIKELLSAIMEKEGILLSIDSKNKNVKFFSYGLYRKNKELGNFSDWSNYFQEYISPNFNTDYGNNYAKKNEISLADPYLGNTYDFILKNQGDDSKYKDFAKQASKLFKDVEAINLVENSISPYNEYTNTGLGLVEQTNIIAGLTQVDDNGTIQGILPALQNVANINYAELPSGVTEWYTLIDRALKGTGTFLIPVEVMKTLDISEPIYVEGLGGYYIIEKIDEYVDAQTKVKVHLIKLLDESPVPEEPGAPSVIDLVLNYNGSSSYQMSLEKKIIGEDMGMNQDWSSEYIMTLDIDRPDADLIMNQNWSSVYSMNLDTGPKAFEDIGGNQNWSSSYQMILSKAPIVVAVTPTLQMVTTAGNITTLDITAGNLIAKTSATQFSQLNKSGYLYAQVTSQHRVTINPSNGSVEMYFNDVTNSSKLQFPTATQDNVALLQNGSGTLAFLSDITGGGATQLIELTDVTSAAVTNGNVLVANGSSYVGRALLKSDISDFGTYVDLTTNQTIGGVKTFSSQLNVLNADVVVTGGRVACQGAVEPSGGVSIPGKSNLDVVLAGGSTVLLSSLGGGGIVLTDLSATSPILYSNTTGVFSHSTAAGNKHIPTGGSTGQVLRNVGSGTAVWSNEAVGITDHTSLSNIGTNSHATIDTHIANSVTNETDSYTATPKATNMITLSQTEYNAIGSPDTNTMYIII